MNTVYCQVKNDQWIYNYAFVDYLVVAGGGSGASTPGGDGAGGGGAGGYRTSYSCACNSCLSLTLGTHPVTVGAGGAAKTAPNCGGDGTNSVFSTITSCGGGGGGVGSPLAFSTGVLQLVVPPAPT